MNYQVFDSGSGLSNTAISQSDMLTLLGGTLIVVENTHPNIIQAIYGQEHLDLALGWNQIVGLPVAEIPVCSTSPNQLDLLTSYRYNSLNGNNGAEVIFTSPAGGRYTANVQIKHQPNETIIIALSKFIQNVEKTSVPWQHLIDTVPYIYFAKDAEMRFIAANKATALAYHTTIENLIGKTDLELGSDTPFNSEALVQADFEILAGQHHEVVLEDFFKTKNGQSKWLEITKKPFYDQDGNIGGLLCFAADIDDKKQISLALQQKEERYALCVNSSSVGVWDWNLQTDELYIDPHLKLLLGYQDNEVVNNMASWSALIHDDDRMNVIEAAEAHILGKTETFYVEHRMVHRSGRAMWFIARGEVIKDAEGLPVRLVGTNSEISVIKETEMALREAQNQLRSIFETAADSIFIKDINEAFVQVNPAMAHRLGATTEQVIGRKSIDFFPQEVANKINVTDKRVLNGETVELEFRGNVLHESVNTHFHAIKTPLRDADGNIIGICGITRNITARKKIEIQLKESEERWYGIVDILPSAVVVFSSEGILYTNRKGLSLYEIDSPDQVIGKKIADLMPKSFLDLHYERSEILDAGLTTSPAEYEVITAKGKRKYLQVTSCRINYKQKTATLAVLDEVTERKMAQIALQSEKERWRGIVDILPNTLLLTHLGEILYVNQKVTELYDLDNADDLIGKEMFDILPVQMHERYLERRKVLYENQFLPPEEFEIVTAKGITKLVNVITTQIDYKGRKSALSIIRDVTKRRMISKKLEESEDRWRSIIDILPSTFLLTQDAEIIYINKKGLELYEIEKSETVVGKSMFDLLPKEMVSMYQRRKNSLESGMSLAPAEYDLITANGNKKRIRVISSLINYLGKKTALSIISDISAEHSTSKLLDQLHNSESTAKDRRAAYLAQLEYEMRKPLTAVLGFSAVFANNDMAAYMKQVQYLIESNAQVALDRLDTFGQLMGLDIDVPQFTATEYDMRALLKSYAHKRNASRGKTQYQLDLPGQRVSVLINQNLLRSLFDALLDNIDLSEDTQSRFRLVENGENIQVVLSLYDQSEANIRHHLVLKKQLEIRDGNLIDFTGSDLSSLLIISILNILNGQIEIVLHDDKSIWYTIYLPRRPAENLELIQTFDAFSRELKPN